jgi:hypothetical protein
LRAVIGSPGIKPPSIAGVVRYLNDVHPARRVKGQRDRDAPGDSKFSTVDVSADCSSESLRRSRRRAFDRQGSQAVTTTALEAAHPKGPAQPIAELATGI